MPCNEETPLLYESERNLKTTVFQMVLSFIGLILCIMLIVLPIIIASMILMGSSHHEDVELSYSILINKLRHRTFQPNTLVDDAESALQYEFVVPSPALESNKIKVDNIKLEDELPESNDSERRYTSNRRKTTFMNMLNIFLMFGILLFIKQKFILKVTSFYNNAMEIVSKKYLRYIKIIRSIRKSSIYTFK